MCSAFWCPPKPGKHDYRDPAAVPQLYLVLTAQRNATQKINKKSQAALGWHSGNRASCIWMALTHFLQLLEQGRNIWGAPGCCTTLARPAQPPALQTVRWGRNLGARGRAVFICAPLRGILISNCADLKPLNGRTGTVVQPSFCVSTLSQEILFEDISRGLMEALIKFSEAFSCCSTTDWTLLSFWLLSN